MRLSLAVLICVTSSLPAQEWAVQPRPITAIGADAGVDEELLAVSGARRLTDGRVLVANGDPLEIRVYSPAGKLLQRAGRKGGGPGEFRGRLDLLHMDGDSIGVFDQRTGRTSVFTTDGKLARELAATPPANRASPIAIFRRTVIRSDTRRADACLRSIIAGMPAPAPGEIREAFPAGDGRYWIRTEKSNSWQVYTPGIRTPATVTLPSRFALYQVGRDFVVGLTRDADDVEQVVVLRIASPPIRTAAACAGQVDSFPAPAGPQADEFKRGMRNVMTLAEVMYSDYARYVSTTDSLRGLDQMIPRNSTFRILRAGARGWAGVLLDTRSTLMCSFGIGDATPAGWPDGVVHCGA